MAEKLTHPLRQRTLSPASYHYWNNVVAQRPSVTCTTRVIILTTPVLINVLNR